MTSLAGIDLDSNLQLIGFETNPDIAYSVRELLGGGAVIQTDQRAVGASLGLLALDDGTIQMGKFCSHQIDSLKTVAAAGQPVVLVHPHGTHTVYILEFDVVQSDRREPPGPNKRFHGTILLQEV